MSRNIRIMDSKETNVLRRLISYIMSYLPSRLPVGMAEFEVWAQEIYGLVGAGFEKVPFRDIKYILASAVIHLGNTTASKPKQYFVRLIRKGGASQVASQVFQNVKAEQAAEAAKAQEKPAEATAPTTETPQASGQEVPKVTS